MFRGNQAEIGNQLAGIVEAGEIAHLGGHDHGDDKAHTAHRLQGLDHRRHRPLRRGKHIAGISGQFSDVFNPATGEVQARVALGGPAELRTAVESALAAQQRWAATNPQRWARVFFNYVALINREMDALAELLSSEHGKTIEDAKGDILRGLEVAEFVAGVPHLLKGEFTEGADLASTCTRCASRSA